MVLWTPPGRSVDATRSLLVVGSLALAAGWVQSRSGDRLFLLAQVGLFAVIAIDGLWSALATARVRVAVTSATTDAVAGQPVTADVSLTGWRRPVLVRMPSPEGAIQVRAEPPEAGTLESVAPWGVFTGVVVEVASKAPLGLLGMTRRLAVALPRPMFIGPRPIPCPDAPFPPAGGTAGDAAASKAGGELVRGVRDHRSDDPLRLVHWPATARTGRLMVKELEQPPEVKASLVLVVDLGAGGPAAESAAGQGSWIATEALRRGYRVVLATFEPEGPVTGPVTSPLAVSRRLAAAVSGPPPVPPPGCERITITVAVTPAPPAPEAP